MIVTSFNILADVFIDFDNSELEYPTIKKEMLRMRNRFNILIKYIKGDIIMLQEVTPYIRSKLISIFGDKYIILPLSIHISNIRKTGNLTLIKRNKFKKIKHTTLYMPRRTSNNAVSVANITLSSNYNLDIYNIHLDDKSNTTRKQELKYIISTFDKTRKIVIGGDFNSDSRKLHHMLKDFEINITPKSTYLCESPMIDYIYTYGFKNSDGYIHNTLNTDNCYQKTISKYGSDHHPIYVHVK